MFIFGNQFRLMNCIDSTRFYEMKKFFVSTWPFFVQIVIIDLKWCEALPQLHYIHIPTKDHNNDDIKLIPSRGNLHKNSLHNIPTSRYRISNSFLRVQLYSFVKPIFTYVVSVTAGKDLEFVAPRKHRQWYFKVHESSYSFC